MVIQLLRYNRSDEAAKAENKDDTLAMPIILIARES